jgi:hypothetical protein
MCWGCAGRGYDLDVQSVELPPFRTIINDYYTCLGYVLTNSHNGLRIRLTIHFLCFWVQYCSGCCPVDNICVFWEIRVHFTLQKFSGLERADSRTSVPFAYRVHRLPIRTLSNRWRQKGCDQSWLATFSDGDGVRANPRRGRVPAAVPVRYVRAVW